MIVCEAFEVKCPKCSADNAIEVQTSALVRFTPDGTDHYAASDCSHEYDDSSPAFCRSCGHSAPFGEFSHEIAEA